MFCAEDIDNARNSATEIGRHMVVEDSRPPSGKCGGFLRADHGPMSERLVHERSGCGPLMSAWSQGSHSTDVANEIRVNACRMRHWIASDINHFGNITQSRFHGAVGQYAWPRSR
jgi:hypothetical protein